MKKAVHDLVWHANEGDGLVCLWIFRRIVQFQEGYDLGTASYFRELK